MMDGSNYQVLERIALYQHGIFETGANNKKRRVAQWFERAGKSQKNTHGCRSTSIQSNYGAAVA